MLTRKLSMAVVSVGILLQFVILCTAQKGGPHKGGNPYLRTTGLPVPIKDGSKGGYPDTTGLPVPIKDGSKGGYPNTTEPPEHFHNDSKGGHHTPPPITINDTTNGGHQYIPTEKTTKGGPQYPTAPPININDTTNGGHPYIPTEKTTKGGDPHFTTGGQNIPTQNPIHTDSTRGPRNDVTHPAGYTGTGTPANAKVIATTAAPGDKKSYVIWWVVGLGLAALLIIVIAITVTCIKKKDSASINEHTPLQEETQEQQTHYN